MADRLAGKVCIITGTGGAMGSAAARLFCAEGARVVGCDIDAARAEATQAAVRAAGGEMVSVYSCDLTKEADCQAVVDRALESYGGIDVVYNNAAMAYFGWIDQITIADFNATINEELNLVFLLCRAVWPHLVKRGRGSIINVGSHNAKVALKNFPGIAHSAAKAAVGAVTRQLAMEGGPHQIRANTISPGVVESAQTLPFINDPGFWPTLKAGIILGRAGKPEDVAACALFLASEESAWITGADFAVDGGSTAWR